PPGAAPAFATPATPCSEPPPSRPRSERASARHDGRKGEPPATSMVAGGSPLRPCRLAQPCGFCASPLSAAGALLLAACCGAETCGDLSSRAGSAGRVSSPSISLTEC